MRRITSQFKLFLTEIEVRMWETNKLAPEKTAFQCFFSFIGYKYFKYICKQFTKT